jgi:hypothetical protein
MKYLYLLFAVSILCSCTVDENHDIENSNTNNFNESVVILQNPTNLKSSIEAQPIYIEMLSFNADFVLEEEYYIDGIQYTDNGSFNDQIANDGIYSSIQSYNSSDLLEKSDFETTINFGGSFKYQEEFTNYLAERYDALDINEKGGIKIKAGCKMRLAPCPETSWWNTCWPLSSPCTCVEFYDCDATIEVDISW